VSTPSRHLRAPQATVIDTHPRRAAILKDIEDDRGTDAQIGRRHGISAGTVRQYRQKWVAEVLAQRRAARGMRTVDGLLTKLEEMADRAARNIAAFEEYLKDPNDPTKIWMGLQAEEVVAHYDQDTGEVTKAGAPITRRKTTQLSVLIAQMAESGKSAFEFTVKRDDTRRLYHDAMRLAMEVIDRVAYLQKMGGEVKINTSRTEIWSFVMSDILRALMEYQTNMLKVLAQFPEALRALEAIPDAKETIVAMFEQKALALEATPDEV
jgi:hypothetical protein